jgi:hypothetical protein
VASAPYSTRFVAVHNLAQTNAFTVGGGYRAIIKSVVATNFSAAAVRVAVTCAGTQVAWHELPVSPSTFEQQLHQVAYAGEQITAGLSKVGASVMVSGYLLRTDAGAAELEEPLPYEVIPWPEWLQL